MHRYYEDILSLTDRKPIWFDEFAVPRFCEFAPDRCANIYPRQAVLYLIACQDCGHQFNVCGSSGPYIHWGFDLEGQVRLGTLHYGDPPNIECCGSGPMMNCRDLRVIEFWEREDFGEFKRRPELEIALRDGLITNGENEQ